MDLPILIVDDDPISRRVLEHALKGSGLRFVTMNSGALALEWLSHSRARLVLLDLVMPAPDGYDVLSRIRSSPAGGDVPVVVLTALDDDQEVSRAFECGADDFVRKPFKPAELIARIKSQLRLRDYVDALARREHDARVVQEITKSLTSNLDFRDILYTVVRRIAEVARVNRCSIVLVRDGKVGVVVAASDDREIRDLPINLDNYPEIQRSFTHGETVVIDEGSDPTVLRGELANYRAAVCIPIRHEERTLGVLFLRTQDKEHLMEHDLWVARTVAHATAIALRNATVLQSLRDENRQSSFARVAAERRARSLEPYADVFLSSADGIIVVAEDGTILFANPRAIELLGSEEVLEGRSFASRIAESHRAAFIELLERRRGGPFSGAKPSTDFPVQVGAHLRTMAISMVEMPRADDGAEILLTFRDVTADRATARELVRTKEFLERVIDSSVDAIIATDMNGEVLLLNGAAERLFGRSLSDSEGALSVTELYAPETLAELSELLRAQVPSGVGRIEDHATVALHASGEALPVRLSAAWIVSEGQPVGFVSVLSDQRERLRMQRSLAEAEERLREKEKQALIAELAGAAAHELNQPLTSISGYAQLLERKLKGDPRGQVEVQTIIRETLRMKELVQKIGRITRYETKSYVGGTRIVDIAQSSEDGG